MARINLFIMLILSLGSAGCKSAYILQESSSAQSRVGGASKIKQVYLVIGQSNTAGRANIEAQDTAILDGVYLLNDQGEWIPARNPMNKYANIRKKLSMQGLGYAYTFGKRMRDLTGQEIGLVVNARGGTKIEQWRKGAPEAYFDSTLVRLEQALALPDTELKGILWHQGESDKLNLTNYMAQLTQFVADWRRIADNQNLPFVAGQISRIRPENNNFNTLITTLPGSIPNTYFVKSNGLSTSDSTHFDAKSQRILGNRYAKTLYKAIQR